MSASSGRLTQQTSCSAMGIALPTAGLITGLIMGLTATVQTLEAEPAAPPSALARPAFDLTDNNPVGVEWFADTQAIKPGRPFRLMVRFHMAKGWHVYHRDVGEIGQPTTVAMAAVPGLTFGEAVFPVPQRVYDTGIDTWSLWHADRLDVVIPVEVAADFASAETVTLVAKPQWLACKTGGACLPGPGDLRLTLTLPVVAADAPDPAPDNVRDFRRAASQRPIAPDKAKHVGLTAAFDKPLIEPHQETTLTVVLTIAPGWHAQSSNPPPGNVATQILLDIPSAFGGPEDRVKQPGWNHRIAWPPTVERKLAALGGKAADFYEGTVTIPVKLKAAASWPVGVRPLLRVMATVQVCDEASCLPPQTLVVELPVPLAGLPANAPTPALDLLTPDDPTAQPPLMVGRYWPVSDSAPTASPKTSAKADAKTPPAVVGATTPATEVVSGPGAATDAGRQDTSWANELLDRFGLLGVLIVGMVAGFVLNFMPCVLPVLGIKILSFVQQGGSEPGRAFKLGLVFSAGLMLVFLALGGVIATLSILGTKFNWGQQFGIPAFSLGIVALMFVFALSLFGVWTLSAPGFVNEMGAKSHGEDYIDALVKGMLATVLATPCTGPGLGALMGWAAGQSPAVIMLAFAATGLGMAAPYLVLTANPALMRLMPRPGAWMERFERVMGFVLMASALFFVNSLYSQYVKYDEAQLANGSYTQTAGAALIGTLGVLITLALGVWVIATVGDRAGRNPRPQLAWSVGLGIIVGGYFLFFGWLTPVPRLSPWAVEPPRRVLVAANDLRALTEAGAYLGIKLDGVTDSEAAAPGGGASQLNAALAKATTLREKVRALAAAGRTVHVDFTAEWCVNCKAVERAVLNTQASAKLRAELGVVLIKADWTDTRGDEGLHIAEWLSELGIAGIPLQAIYPANQPDKPILIPDVFTQDTYHNALRQAGPSVAAKP